MGAPRGDVTTHQQTGPGVFWGAGHNGGVCPLQAAHSGGLELEVYVCDMRE